MWKAAADQAQRSLGVDVPQAVERAFVRILDRERFRRTGVVDQPVYPAKTLERPVDPPFCAAAVKCVKPAILALTVGRAVAAGQLVRLAGAQADPVAIGEQLGGNGRGRSPCWRPTPE